MRIIVIDDEIAALNTFLPEVLDSPELDCKMFMREPEKALAFCERNTVDAAFLDINMPSANGVDLAEKLIKINKNIKIIFISGYTQDESAISKRIGANLTGFCYKPYSGEIVQRYIDEVRDSLSEQRTVFIRTFGSFDVFLNGKPLVISSRKSKELLALLTDKCGSFVTMGEVIAALWPDKPLDFAKRLYRDAVCRLRLTLTDYKLPSLVSFFRAKTALNTDNVRCDLWDFYKDETALFGGDYMPHYDWSVETQSLLEKISEKRQNGKTK